MSLTWETALCLHLKRREASALSPGTIKLERRLILAAAKRIGGCPAAVDRETVKLYLAGRLAEVRPGTVAREVTVLRGLFEFLVGEELVGSDPFEGVSIKVPQQLQLVLSEADIQAMFEVASIPVKARRSQEASEALALRNRAAVEVLYATGVRATELCNALVTDFDLQSPSMFVRRVKRGPHESLPLAASTLEHQHAYLLRARPVLLRLRDESGGACFVNERGARLTGNYLLEIVSGVARRAGFHAHPHAIRRSVATGLVRNGASLPAVQALLGHKRLDTTQRYVRVSVEELRASVDMLDYSSD